MGIISIVNNIKNKLSAKEQDDLSEYILLAKDEAIKNESFIPKQGGIPIISNILVEAIAIKNEDVGLKDLTGLFDTYRKPNYTPWDIPTGRKKISQHI